MRYIGGACLRDVLDARAIELAVEAGMRALSGDLIVAPPRTALVDKAGGPVLGLMYGSAAPIERAGAKVVGLSGSAGHSGLMALFDESDGSCVAVIDGAALTSLRTAAASAVATRLLARPDARHLAVLGSGAQARAHVAHFRERFDLATIRIFSRSFGNAERLAAEFGAEACRTVAEAVEGADIICTATRSSDPLVRGDVIGEGVHINLVGSSFAHSREVDDAIVARSRFFVDHAAAVREQGGEFRSALASGAIGEDHIAGELGGLLLNGTAGRTDRRQLTVYKSLGSIAQDLYVADAAVRAASTAGAGVDLS